MEYPRDVGILAVEVYFPNQYVSLELLCALLCH